MGSLLLVIIYISFISLGLPDSLLGSAWPVMYEEINVPFSYAGIITMIVSFCTIISSLLSERMNRKLGTGLVTAISVFMTAVALIGFSQTHTFWILCLWSIPYGLGAGGVDAALNNYVSLHYKSRHINWLHCMWGVGASISPYIMSACLTGGLGWNKGYWSVGIIQILLAIALFMTLPMWKNKKKAQTQNKTQENKPVSIKKALGIPGVKQILVAFFAYCALEQTAMLWASSFLVKSREIEPNTAAGLASMFLIGMAVGRFISGLISDKIGDRNMIRNGTIIIAIGIVLILLPGKISLAGFIILGLGCAPIYPAIIHSTPRNFGANNSQAIIGIQMASAYIGSTFMPPLFGIIAQNIGTDVLSIYLAVLAILMLVMTEKLNKIVNERRRRARQRKMEKEKDIFYIQNPMTKEKEPEDIRTEKQIVGDHINEQIENNIIDIIE